MMSVTGFAAFLVGLILAQHSEKRGEQTGFVIKDSMAVGHHAARAFIDRCRVQPFNRAGARCRPSDKAAVCWKAAARIQAG